MAGSLWFGKRKVRKQIGGLDVIHGKSGSPVIGPTTTSSFVVGGLCVGRRLQAPVAVGCAPIASRGCGNRVWDPNLLNLDPIPTRTDRTPGSGLKAKLNVLLAGNTGQTQAPLLFSIQF